MVIYYNNQTKSDLEFVKVSWIFVRKFRSNGLWIETVNTKMVT